MKRTQAGIDVLAERERQVTEEDWSLEHDDDHDGGQMAMAAACYAAPERLFRQETFAAGVRFVDPWPWDERWDARYYDGNVLQATTDEQYRKLLVKAGALIIAEIERLDRAAQRPRQAAE